ncbi:isoquinoline 1-oxidoreductase, beta subunit, putative [Pseudooceanicola batsensis HTCC2597]|uniref:Isoquinoline 1-oxidoreductase, beta subunit, putative n=1 Tax=Pseudooceanicola batsensis (strain ATCC BAA-863 / DSM 15984 / KCTC 12145 / HTCC2597) TaxID=252305 RepID=A3U455_PSEBH|nr:molybdopterin cofactor-binding domain-containing protein [Pseudooceanicola batsensis]EAQ01042.1 isoquinoline 1-oxidoreductase, beta subunit, putative [Pseudooceanicola batsensis HTCC2597]
MSRIGKIARRSFLIGTAAVAGGVAFGVYAARRPAPSPLSPAEGEVALNPFIVIDRAAVTVIVPKAEMGQGVQTTWATLAAEELDMEPADLRIAHGPPGKAYYNRAMGTQMLPVANYRLSNWQENLGAQMAVAGKFLNLQVTGGSTSTADGFDKMRHAGASARETLKEAAARRLGVARSALKTQGGAVVAPDGSRLPYTELAADAAGIDPVTAELRPQNAWRHLGKSQPRHDQAPKATGTAEFSIDVRLEGMKFAALKRNPYQGGAMHGFDASEALDIAGVERVIDLGDGVAVVASNSWSAMRGAEAVRFDWGKGSYPETTEEMFAAFDTAMKGGANSTFLDRGDADTLPNGATEVRADYAVPYLSHAQMEPLCATALYHGDRIEVWSGNQIPIHCRAAAAEEAGLDPEAVTLHTPLMGGGFGRRGYTDFTRYAARLAVRMQGTPVQLLWSREEDMTHGYYRPGAIASFRGAVRDGRAVLLDGRISGQAATPSLVRMLLGFAPPGPDKGHVEGAYDQPYAIPNARISGHVAELDLPVGPWRSVGASVNGFFFDSFLDEMAHAAGADPLTFRLEMMKDEDPGSAAVLEAVREASGWTGRTPDGVGRGVAFCHSFGTPVAEVIEVHRTEAGIRIAKAWIAADPGLALDPGNIEAQLFGGMAYGLSAAVHQQITFADGAAEQQNFYDYDAIRMNTMPEVVDIRILQSGDGIGGIGEPGTPPAAAALANALFDLTGERARRLPLADQFDFVV